MRIISVCLVFLVLGLHLNVLAQNVQTIGHFHKLSLSKGIMLQLEQKPAYTLSFTTLEPDSSCLIKTLEKGELLLGIKSGSSCKGRVIAYLTCPDIKEIEIQGKAELSSDKGFTVDSLTIDIKSNGKAFIQVDVKYLRTTLSGGGLLKINGSAAYQDIAISTSASFSGFELLGENVIVNTMSSGVAKICALKSLEATAFGNSQIMYKGNPPREVLKPSSGGVIVKTSE